MPNLKGKIAVVTGASRGAGRAIAISLGEAGATVYVTGRSVRGASRRPETIDDTAEAITERGGVGIAVQVDHTNDAQAEAFFQRVQQEQGRLDILVNNAWGGHDDPTGDGPFWQYSPKLWDNMFTGGVRASLMSSRFAVPLMLPHRQGLIINTSFKYDPDRYDGFLYYQLAKNALCNLATYMAGDLKPHGIAALAVSPGWMRTELVLEHYGATEETWRSFPDLATTESPFYVGRAVAHLAADPNVLDKSGGAYQVGNLAQEYGFTDIDGRVVPPFKLH